jgi:hypothetical protein
MKNVFRFSFLTLLAMALCAPAALAGGPHSQPGKIVVPCSTADSSQALADALNAIPPGGTVFLKACTYYLSGPVQVTGSFRGRLKGSGKGKTLITTLPDADGIEDVLIPNWITNLDDPDVWGPTYGPTLFHFHTPEGMASDIRMSDLTIEITDPDPAFASARAGWFANALLAIITIDGQRVDTRLERLELKGAQTATWIGSNVFYGVEMWGTLDWSVPLDEPLGPNPMVGRHVIARSHFEDLWVGYNTTEMIDSKVRMEGNTLINPSNCGFVVGGYTVNTRNRVAHNRIELSNDFAVGICLGGERGLTVQNRISGHGWSGIYLSSATRTGVVANDVSGLTVAPDGARVYLEASTSKNLVVVRDEEDVLDLGTDNRIIVR